MPNATPSPAGLRIGQLAGELGLNPKTLRYYEAIGLLHPPRTAAGYRLYGPAERERLRFVIQAKALGFTLQEILEILALRDAGTEPCAHVRSLIVTRLAAVTAQLHLLSELHAELQVLHREAQDTTCSCTPICGAIERHVPARRDATQIPDPTSHG